MKLTDCKTQKNGIFEFVKKIHSNYKKSVAAYQTYDKYINPLIAQQRPTNYAKFCTFSMLLQQILLYK